MTVNSELAEAVADVSAHFAPDEVMAEQAANFANDEHGGTPLGVNRVVSQ